MSSQSEIWTITKLLTWTSERFARAQIQDPRVDAEHLLCFALNCSRMQLYLDHDKPMDAAALARFRTLVQRRLTREPVAYITEHRGFHALDLELFVDRRVLIPRPETEHMVDWVLEFLKPLPAPPMHILDIGTGSGAIALAIKRARPDVHVVATDISPDALAIAQKNAVLCSLSIDWIQSNLLNNIANPEQGWTAICANLPYIPSSEIPSLQLEVSQFEPLQALDGGADGLDIIRQLIQECAQKQALAKQGRLFLEIGHGQAAEVQHLLHTNGFVDISIRKDLNHIERIISGRFF